MQKPRYASSRSGERPEIENKMTKVTVRFTANFEANLTSIEAFWVENKYPKGFDRLLDELGDTVISNLERFPKMGRPFFKGQAESVEALARLEKIESRVARLDGEGELREYMMGDYIVLYAVLKSTVYLLAIKHHRQLSFDLNPSFTK